jgi:hypothetical protein
MRGGAVPGLPALHKTESAFKPGQTHTDDPEEEEKQRKFKVSWRMNCNQAEQGSRGSKRQLSWGKRG